MRLEWIEDVLAVRDAGSLTAAAQQRRLTQSAFTRRLHLIERSIGADIFDRTSKPLKLLPNVEEQIGEMRLIAARLDALRSALIDQSEIASGRVSFACQHTLATTISPKLIRDVTRDGKVKVKIKSGSRDDCLLMLMTSVVNFALIYETINETITRPDTVFLEQQLGSDWMIPVVAAYYERELLAALDRGELPVIAYPGDVFLGQLFEDSFLSLVSPKYQIIRTAETELAIAALNYSLESIGVGWVPQSIARVHLEHGTLIDISDRLPRKELKVKIIRLQNVASPLVSSIWNQIKAVRSAG